jgi:hypothetical protein
MKNAISANRLSDGIVIFFAGDAGWVETLAKARLFEDGAATEAALEQARVSERANQLVEPYAFAVRDHAGVTTADHLREAIRAAGPTVRRDLGKQAHAG